MGPAGREWIEGVAVIFLDRVIVVQRRNMLCSQNATNSLLRARQRQSGASRVASLLLNQ